MTKSYPGLIGPPSVLGVARQIPSRPGQPPGRDGRPIAWPAAGTVVFVGWESVTRLLRAALIVLVTLSRYAEGSAFHLFMLYVFGIHQC